MTSPGGPSARGSKGVQIVLVRHAETEWSKSGQHTGRTDLPLTGEGVAQARGLRAALARYRFARVLSSPLQRAVETARLAGLEDVELDDDLREWDYGVYEGRTTAAVHEERPDWDLWSDGAPGGESPDDVAARADRVVRRLEAAGGDVCVVAHGHVLRMLAGRWLEQPPDFGRRLPLPPAHLSVLGWERGARALRAWALPPAPPTS